MRRALPFLPLPIPLLASFLLLASGLFAQSVPAADPVPLARVINADGTLDRDAARRALETGSIDPRGWTLVADAAGRPHFVRGEELAPDLFMSALPEIGGDENWDGGFGGFTMDGDIYAIAVDGENVYIGGSFDNIAGFVAHGIVMWDGADWHALGSGLNGSVYALAVSGGSLYVGGEFTTAGGVGGSNLAAWNMGAGQWGSVGGGVTASGYSYVSVITAYENDIVIGGSFSRAGSVSANNIVRWSPAARSFSPIGSGPDNGTNGDVLAIAPRGKELFVGGYFQTAGGDSIASVARWSELSGRWLPLGANRLKGYVNAIAVGPNRVYIGGRIDSVGTMPTSNMVIWNGDAEPMASDMGRVNYLSGIVHTLTAYYSFIFAAGGFRIAYPGFPAEAIASVNNVAYWDRDTLPTSGWEGLWHSLDIQTHAGVDGYATALAVANNSVYVGGVYRTAGGRIRGRVARWQMHTLYPDIHNPGERGAWYAIGVGVAASGPVTAMAANGGEIYAATGALLPDGRPITNIVKYDGTRWSAIRQPIDGAVNALELVGDNLYVGGRFDAIALNATDTLRAINIARYNVTARSWFPLDSGLLHWDRPTDSTPAFVTALAVHGDDLYAGGEFDQAGTGHLPVNNIARWSIAAGRWSAMDRGVYGYVNDVAVAADGTPYIGGAFLAAADPSVKYLGRWDGSAWRHVGGSDADTVNNTVDAVAIGEEGGLYIGGRFTTVGTDSIGSIAHWDGTRWSRLGSGIGGEGFPGVNDIAVAGGEVYVAGSFSLAGGDSAANIAEWDGRAWWRLGSGSDDEIRAIRVVGGSLYVGGSFGETGLKPTLYFGRWTRPTLEVAEEEIIGGGGALRARELPGGAVEIIFPAGGGRGGDLGIYDMRGEVIWRPADDALAGGGDRMLLDASALSRGIYLCRYRGAGGVASCLLPIR